MGFDPFAAIPVLDTSARARVNDADVRQLVPALVIVAELVTLSRFVIPLPKQEGTRDDVFDSVIAPHIPVQRVRGKHLCLLDIDQHPLALTFGLLDCFVVAAPFVVLRGREKLVDSLALSHLLILLLFTGSGTSPCRIATAIKRHPPKHCSGVGGHLLLHPPMLKIRIYDLVLVRRHWCSDFLLAGHVCILQRACIYTSRSRGRCYFSSHVSIDNRLVCSRSCGSCRRRRGPECGRRTSSAHLEEQA
mmetsp:Transcript_109847/g.261906  ORF Transcript_109847/g.261906 Transcript_109847/m.261906 type:complete len:247 (+) Transcript_109847:726-1466(+)